MRKQTKLVAVLSAAALLAMGASMTSFAAGWEKDDAGVWHYYDKDDEMVTGEWRKDGAKWFYLDEDGDMLTDSWVDDEYYVGADGAMLVNQWAKTASEDAVDDPDEDGDHWFYFGSKGKKISNDKKKIGGKTYFFNEDGEMRDGWYETESGDVYYLGEEDEGWRAENQWLWLERPTDEDAEDDEWSDDDCTIGCDDEGWYWFGSDGKRYSDNKKKKTINGKHYFFNAHGQMLYEWINTKDGNTSDGSENIAASRSEVEKASGSDALQEFDSNTVEDMRYANQVEDGSRTDGWYEIAGSEDAGADEDTEWYFFKDGKAKKADSNDLVKVDGTVVTDDGALVYRARIKCDGKYFCFNELGQMQTGLQLINGYFYYFDDNGYMKTGKVADVEEADDDAYTYYFETKNNGNGRGISAIKDGYLYWNGKRVEADDDYALYWLGGDQIYLVNSKGKVQKTPKKYALDSVSGDDIYVDIKNNKVKSLSEEKNGASIDLTVPATVMELAKEEVIWVPHILIYDENLVPVVVHNNK